MTHVDEFTRGVVFAASYICGAHGDTVGARDILRAAGVEPSDEMRWCAEADLSTLREMLIEWRNVPRGT